MKPTFIYKNPKTILNKGTGFLSGYSHSLNPYTGCSYGCAYCYVREMPVSIFRNEAWGTWVDIKQGADIVFKKEYQRARMKGPVTLFMSSSTDPYQPIEHQEKITRSLLAIMAEDPPDFLLVQTRSPLVTRDIDLLANFGANVRVSLTIETDREDIRKIFTPAAPPIAARLKTLQVLKDAGIPTQAAIAPVLPCTERFAEALMPWVDRVCIDDYFMGDGSRGKRTKRLNIQSLYPQNDADKWYHQKAYHMVYEQMKSHFPEEQLFISQKGFEP